MIKTKEDIVKDYELWVYRQLGRLVSSQTTNVGSFISTDGIKLIWSGGGSSLPSQSGNAGKFLTTDGTNTSWATVTAPVWGAITGTLSSQTDLQSALDAKEATANKGSAGGYASLDGTGKVPSSQLPSYVDDVLEYANLAALPVTGSTGIIYVTIDNNKTYRWTGSAYTEISPNTPAGSNTQVQFNNSGAFGASANATWNGTGINISQNVSGGGSERLLLKASSTSNANTLIDARSSSNNLIFAVKDGGQILFSSFAALGNASTEFYGGTLTDDRAFYFTGINSTNSTSGAKGVVGIGNTFNPTSGTATHNTLKIASTINQTGGANGITRGLYIAETITAAADYRALESTNGKIVLTDTHAAGSGSLAGSLLDLSQTWSTSGTPTAIKLNVTDSGSNAASKLLDLQLSTATRFDVTKTGFRLVANANSSSGVYYASTSLQPITFFGSDSTAVTINNNIDATWAAVLFKGNVAATTSQIKSSSTVFTPSTGTNNIALYDSTYAINSTGGTNTVTGFKINATETSITGTTHNLIDLQVGGTSQFKVSRDGALNLLERGATNAGLVFGANNDKAIYASSTTMTLSHFNAVSIRLWDGSAYTADKFRFALVSTDPILQFGGTTSSFPAFKRSSAAIHVRLADDSNFADLYAGRIIGSNNVLAGVTSSFGFNGSTFFNAAVDGNLRISNWAGNNFGLLQFGGTTSSFPAWKRSSATLQARLADDSDFAAVQSLYQRFGAGSPEGVVTAPVGAIYHRTDGGANTSLYVKESGAGNTGWIAK